MIDDRFVSATEALSGIGDDKVRLYKGISVLKELQVNIDVMVSGFQLIRSHKGERLLADRIVFFEEVQNHSTDIAALIQKAEYLLSELDEVYSSLVTTICQSDEYEAWRVAGLLSNLPDSHQTSGVLREITSLSQNISVSMRNYKNIELH